MEGKPEIIDFSYAIRGTLLPTMLSHKAHKHRCTVRTLQKRRKSQVNTLAQHTAKRKQYNIGDHTWGAPNSFLPNLLCVGDSISNTAAHAERSGNTESAEPLPLLRPWTTFRFGFCSAPPNVAWEHRCIWTMLDQTSSFLWSKLLCKWPT